MEPRTNSYDRLVVKLAELALVAFVAIAFYTQVYVPKYNPTPVVDGCRCLPSTPHAPRRTGSTGDVTSLTEIK